MSADVKNVVKEQLEKDVQSFSNVNESEVSKEQLLKRVKDEVSIINSVEKQDLEADLRKKEYELKKDHTYSQDKREEDHAKLEKEKFELEKEIHKDSKNFEKEKFELEKANREDSKKLERERFEFEKERFKEEKAQNVNRKRVSEANYDLEKMKLEFERDRVKFEQESLRVQQEIRKDNSKYQMIGLLVTGGVALLTFIGQLIAIGQADRAHKRTMALIYLDEGRSTTELKDSVKRLDNFIRK